MLPNWCSVAQASHPHDCSEIGFSSLDRILHARDFGDKWCGCAPTVAGARSRRGRTYAILLFLSNTYTWRYSHICPGVWSVRFARSVLFGHKKIRSSKNATRIMFCLFDLFVFSLRSFRSGLRSRPNRPILDKMQHLVQFQFPLVENGAIGPVHLGL
jgi:hypothetical protein